MRPPRSATRVGRGLLFLAIVWSIAGAFLALQLGQSELLSLASSRGWIDAGLLMPATTDTTASDCPQAATAEAGAPSRRANAPAVTREARYATWLLGERLGFAAGMASAGVSADQLDALMADIAAAARTLGIVPPRPPLIRHAANALPEFGAFVEADPDCVAARLSARYGPRFGQLYKFGAVIGHAIPYQANGVGAAFAPQIAVYGTAAAIPREFWLPMTSEALDGAPGKNPREKISLIIARLDDYLRRDR